MPEQELINVFTRVSGAAVAAVPQKYCQEDCIVLGKAVGFTDEELKEHFPHLYAEEPTEVVEDHYPEPDQEEDDSVTEVDEDYNEQ